MTDPQAEAVAALAGAITDHDDICSRMAIPECSDLILAAIQQDPAARAALVAVLAPPSPEPLRAALALLLTATDERTDCYEHADNCCSDWCESCKRGRIAGRCLREARKKARAALAHTEPAPEGEPHPDPLWRVALANTEAYVRGHWDGLHCDAKGFGGILDECEHVGRIYEPRAATPPSPAPEGERPMGGSYNDWFGKAILAIEAEAIAQERERLRVAVEGLPSYGVQDNWVPDGFGGTDHENVDTVSRADVLALLSPDTGATTGGES